MAAITVQTPHHAKGGLQCRWNAKQTREHTILHRLRSTDRTRKENDEVLPYESGPPKHHLRIPLVRGIPTKDRLGERMDGLCPITSRIEDLKR